MGLLERRKLEVCDPSWKEHRWKVLASDAFEGAVHFLNAG